jgi:hypothetical protein
MKPHRPLAHPPFVALAGLSARWLAQSAARAGLHAAALDIFGDRDTREAAGSTSARQVARSRSTGRGSSMG